MRVRALGLGIPLVIALLAVPLVVGAQQAGKIYRVGILAPEAMAVQQRARLVSLATKHRLPTMYGFRLFVDAGGLMSYGPDLSALSRRAAVYVDKILKGAQRGQPRSIRWLVERFTPA